jgi:hypothetical protein
MKLHGHHRGRSVAPADQTRRPLSCRRRRVGPGRLAALVGLPGCGCHSGSATPCHKTVRETHRGVNMVLHLAASAGTSDQPRVVLRVSTASPHGGDSSAIPHRRAARRADVPSVRGCRRAPIGMAAEQHSHQWAASAVSGMGQDGRCLEEPPKVLCGAARTLRPDPDSSPSAVSPGAGTRSVPAQDTSWEACDR